MHFNLLLQFHLPIVAVGKCLKFSFYKRLRTDKRKLRISFLEFKITFFITF
jgi:hypothetical protein